MFLTRMRSKRLAQVFLCLLGLLLVACGGANSSGSSAPNVDNGPGGSFNASPLPVLRTPQSTTIQMPPTATGCPQSALTGRAAVIRPLALGNDAGVVYIADQGNAPGGASIAELKIYDATAGAASANHKNVAGSSTIVHLPGAVIREAQVSSDGRWVLFVTELAQASEIQMVRLDGQGLQTLYCAPAGTLQSVQWAPDQTRFLFSQQQATSGVWGLYLFTLASGTVQLALAQSGTSAVGYEARTWLDNRRAYVVGVPNAFVPIPARGLFVLDTSKGTNQQPTHLLTVAPLSQVHVCWSFDSDYNMTTLITSRCTALPGAGDLSGQQGPSTIVSQGVTGGSQRTIYTSRQDAVTQVRMLGYASDTLLMCVGNLNPAAPLSVAPDNGLWRMRLDGSEKEHLATADNLSACEFNRFGQYPWANLSLDTTLYSIEFHQLLGKVASVTLNYGALKGGHVVPFATAADGAGMLAIAGWSRV
jgi:hypothetical protein